MYLFMNYKKVAPRCPRKTAANSPENATIPKEIITFKEFLMQ